MILINFQEMDFIELFERSERSGLVHFTIILFNSNEVLPKFMYLLWCDTKTILKYERCGITLKVIFKVAKVQFGP